MSDAIPGAAAPQGGVAPAAPATPPAAPDAKPHTAAADLPPEALKARLDSAKEAARRELLTELGVSDPKDVKASLAELKTRRDAEKTESERLAARVAELEGKAAKAEHATQVAARRAAAELASLTDAQRAYVAKAAGDDPLRQLETIDTLRETGLLTAPPAVPAPAQTPGAAPAAAPPTPPATTAPTAGAPPPSGTVSPVDHKATFDSLRKSNPVVAAAYARRHGLLNPSR